MYTKHLYQSSLLSAVPHLVHGFSLRSLGDMKKSDNRAKLVQTLFPGTSTLVLGQQVHGSAIGAISDTVMESDTIPGVDALVYPVTGRVSKLLGVVVADCVPVLLVDKQAKIVATVHSGWKGTLSAIVPKTVATMIDRGASPDSMYAVIGPHIGMCHYDVPPARADMFLQAFGKDTSIVSFSEGAWRLDLGRAVLSQLLGAGLAASHIDAPITCTACQNNLFFSYRRDSKATFGEMMGVIGFI